MYPDNYFFFSLLIFLLCNLPWVNFSLQVSSLLYLIVLANQPCFVAKDFFKILIDMFVDLILSCSYLTLYVVVVYTSSSTDLNICLRCFRLGFRLVVCIIRLYDFIPHFPVYELPEMAAHVSPTFLARCNYILGSICTITTSEE